MEISPGPDFLSSSNLLKAHVDDLLSFLSTARPTAVNLGAAMRRMKNSLHSAITAGKDVKDIVEELIAEGKLIADEDTDRNRKMSKCGAEWLVQLHKDVRTNERALNILTVCNTGSLATSVSFILDPFPSMTTTIWKGYGTALGLITYLHETGNLGKTYYTQTAPYHQGSRSVIFRFQVRYWLKVFFRLTSLELQTLGIPSVMICDTMVGSLFQQHEIHAVGKPSLHPAFNC
jgi:methylthioribose-1-phosphate isomerase